MALMLSLANLSRACAELAAALNGDERAGALLLAASALAPVTAGFVVVNLPHAPPLYLADSYHGEEARAAVQRYVRGTYLLNPVWNAIRAGLSPGIHRMADLAPDSWGKWQDDDSVLPAAGEEIGYLTPGWPAGLAEVSILSALPGGAMAEVSLARPMADGGFSEAMLDNLRAFLPLFHAAQAMLWARQARVPSRPTLRRLEDFGHGRVSPREAEILRMVLKGHSNLSIGLTLGITVPTVKTHRRNAYAKLGIATQQELFSTFLTWAESEV